jgi:hypothetical protein
VKCAEKFLECVVKFLECVEKLSPNIKIILLFFLLKCEYLPGIIALNTIHMRIVIRITIKILIKCLKNILIEKNFQRVLTKKKIYSILMAAIFLPGVSSNFYLKLILVVLNFY